MSEPFPMIEANEGAHSRGATDAVRAPERVRLFRWVFAIGVLQLILYYLVPAIQFPRGYVLHIEAISALTLGNVVTGFFLLLSVGGLAIDRRWRRVYVSSLVAVGLWLTLVAITWHRVERWDFLLR